MILTGWKNEIPLTTSSIPIEVTDGHVSAGIGILEISATGTVLDVSVAVDNGRFDFINRRPLLSLWCLSFGRDLNRRRIVLSKRKCHGRKCEHESNYGSFKHPILHCDVPKIFSRWLWAATTMS